MSAHTQNVTDSSFGRPALLQSVDADLSLLRDVGVEDLGDHGACRDEEDSLGISQQPGRTKRQGDEHFGGCEGYVSPNANLILK